MVNGASFGKRTVDAAKKSGETTFTIDLTALKDGDNTVEVRLIDKSGKLVGTERSIITTDEGNKGPVFVVNPRMGATVQGPVEIRLGFGKEMKSIYVSFFIDSQFKLMSNYPPYSYVWDTTRELNGWHEVEAWVVDDSSDTYKSRKVKVFVNNPGGNTKRRIEPATEPKAVPTTAGPAPKPEPRRVEGLTPSSAAITAQPAGTAGVKPTTSVPSGNATGRAGGPSAPTATPMREAANTARPAASGASDLKTAKTQPSEAAGPKYLTPTGKRNAPKPSEPKADPTTDLPVLPKPTADAPKAIVVTKPNATVATKPTEPRNTSIKLEPKPVSTAAPKAIATITVSKPSEPALRPAEPKGVVATKPEPKPAPAPKPAPKLVPVTKGSALPMAGKYTITLNSAVVHFPDVQPWVDQGVALTPLRHLFEQAGGEVKWAHESKSVEAIGEGQTIELAIGQQRALINKLPVEMELAPFLRSNRMVIPLSFVRDALKVNVDYDPKTGHVLITKSDSGKKL